MLLLGLILVLPVAAIPPHIIHIVADDLGYNDLGRFNGGKTVTPNIDALIADGVLLDNFHAWRICAPSRASSMTGRYPFNVGFYNMDQDQNHCADKYTMLPEVLKMTAGYQTAATGKWDVGFIKSSCTPTERGFDSFLGYYTACTANYWYHGSPFCIDKEGVATGADFSHSNGPVIRGANMTAVNGTYDRQVFQDFATQRIAAHDPSQPLYLYVAWHNVHDACPADRYVNGLNAPCPTMFQHYNTTQLDTWKVQAAMTTELDIGVGAVVAALKARGLYDNSVIFFNADNGGPLDHSTNSPLRGGKAQMWEGGFRVMAFAHSPLFPAARRGGTYAGLMHVADLYPTFVQGVAGQALPAHTGPNPVDGINQWDAIVHNTPSPRTTAVLEVHNQYNKGASAIIHNGFKLIRGPIANQTVHAWPAPAPSPVPFGHSSGSIEPGTTDHCVAGLLKLDAAAGKVCDPHCLFHLDVDVSESYDLAGAAQYQDLIRTMTQLLDAAGAGAAPPAYVYPDFTTMEKEMCANQTATGFLEPLDWQRGN
eukprot:m.159470 g.159470  ORF g.159470 m.159470 type:complete len:537 (+) comp20908_c0_seq1:1127-2737(+)